MHPFHILISVWNLLSAMAFLSLFLIHEQGAVKEFLAGFSVAGGYLANAVAIIVSISMALAYIYRIAKGASEGFMSRHWLGLFNGAFVIFSWSAFFIWAKYN